MASHAHPHPHQHPSKLGDLAGQLLSLLCLVHCLATPLVLMFAPVAAGFLGGWHPVLLVGVLAVAVWAFVPGYRYHRSGTVLALASAGLGLLALGTLAFHATFWLETTLTMTGAALMLTAHWKNRALSAQCRV